ncbi:MAG: CrcB family protein [Planctomycetota bacterium]
MHWHAALAVAIGGGVGAVTRYAVSLACAAWLGDRFGYGTLAVNVAGCFLLGLLTHGGLAEAARAPWLSHPGLTAGLLGGLTTFSAFGLQSVAHLERGEWLLGVGNVAANVVLGCAAAAAGLAASRALGPA